MTPAAAAARAVGIGAFVVQEPPPGTTAKLGREGATLSAPVGSRSQLIADNATGRNRVARQPSGIAPTRRDSAARCFTVLSFQSPETLPPISVDRSQASGDPAHAVRARVAVIVMPRYLTAGPCPPSVSDTSCAPRWSVCIGLLACRTACDAPDVITPRNVARAST